MQRRGGGRAPLLARARRGPARGRTLSDPYASRKDNAWREIAEIEARFKAGAIDEQAWHDEMAALVVPAYLAAGTPWGQSGKSGTLEDWRYARDLVVDAFDRDGTFLDIGCANGFLMESVVEWSRYAIDPYGIDIAPELVELARRRVPQWSDRIVLANALTWRPPLRFTYARTNLDCVPSSRRRELVSHLLGWCERLLVGVFNEERHARPIEELLRTWSFEIAGRSERPHRTHPDMDYRLIWIDA